jgi:predicted DNA-binding transcriptional regulator YafY
MYLERMQTLERLHTLIHRKATGDRTALARKLDTSERSVYRMLDQLRYLGAEIGYDSERPSYYYVNDFALQVTVKVWIDGEEFLIIGGGE